MRPVHLPLAVLLACAPDALPVDAAPPSFAVLLGSGSSASACRDGLRLALVETGDPRAPVALLAPLDPTAPPPGQIPILGAQLPRPSRLRAAVGADGSATLSCPAGPGVDRVGFETSLGLVGVTWTTTNAAPACPAGGLTLPVLPEGGGTIALAGLGVTDADDDPLSPVAVRLLDASGAALQQASPAPATFTIRAHDGYLAAPVTMQVSTSDGWTKTTCEAPLTWDRAPACAPATVEVERGATEVLVTPADLCLDPEGLDVTTQSVIDGAGRPLPFTIAGTDVRVAPPSGGDGRFTIVVRDTRNQVSLPVTMSIQSVPPLCPVNRRLQADAAGELVVDPLALGVTDADGDPLAAIDVALISPDGEPLELPGSGGMFTIQAPDPELRDRAIAWTTLNVTMDDGYRQTTCPFEVATHDHAVCADALRRTVRSDEAEVLVTAADLCLDPSGGAFTIQGVRDASGAATPFSQDADGDLRVATPGPGASQFTIQAPDGPVGFTIVVRDVYTPAGETPVIPASGGVVDVDALAGATCTSAAVIAPDGSLLQRGKVRQGQFTIRVAPTEEQGDALVGPLLVASCATAVGPALLSWEVPVDRAPVCADGAEVTVAPGAPRAVIDPGAACADPDARPLSVGHLTTATGAPVAWAPQPDGTALVLLPPGDAGLELAAWVTDGPNRAGPLAFTIRVASP